VRDLLACIPEASYLSAPDYGPAVLAWARAEARCIQLARYLREHGQLDRSGRPRPASEYGIRLERIAHELRSRLGLDPRSRAALGRDVTGAQVDLAHLWAVSERLREGEE
jgi:hypothetical protein